MATKKNTAVKIGDKEYEYYRITRTVGHEWKDGKKVPVKKQFIGTSKTNAENKYKKWQKDQENKNKSVVDSNKTFGDVLTYYKNNILAVNSKYAEGTRNLYSAAAEKHILPCEDLCGKTINLITAEDIQLCYNSLSCGESAMATVNKFMVGFFKWAVANRYCENVMPAVIIPVKKRTKVNCSENIIVRSDAEMKKIIKCSKGLWLHALFITAVYTGMRISELFGLRYENIQKDSIHVCSQYYRGTFKLPKCEKIRHIPLHPMVKKAISEHRPNEASDSDLVFSTVIGTPLDYQNTMKRIKKFYDEYGIEHKKFHAYRATFCTNLCKEKVPLQTAAALMGHESVEVTAKYYAFVDKKDKKNAVLKLKSYD